MSGPILEVKNLAAFYGPIQVLHGIDFPVEEGGVTALLGANGAGKTTTLRAICGMVRTEGDIMLGGNPIAGMATEDIVRRGVAHVPDGRGTFMELTVEENMRLGAYIRKDRSDRGGFRADVRLLSPPQERLSPAGGHAVRRRAADAGDHRALLMRPSLAAVG